MTAPPHLRVVERESNRAALGDNRGGPLMTADEVAAWLAVSRKTVNRMDQSGKLPCPVRIGRLLRWRRGDVERWIADGCPDRATWERQQRPAR